MELTYRREGKLSGCAECAVFSDVQCSILHSAHFTFPRKNWCNLSYIIIPPHNFLHRRKARPQKYCTVQCYRDLGVGVWEFLRQLPLTWFDPPGRPLPGANSYLTTLQGFLGFRSLTSFEFYNLKAFFCDFFLVHD